MNNGKKEIRVIGVIGSGTMGHGIAQICAMAEYEVILTDINEEILSGNLSKIKWSLDKLSEKKQITKEEAEKAYERIKRSTKLSEMATKCDLIIEAAPENIKIKSSIYKEIDSKAPPHVIFASNTSTLPITEIASYTTRPKQVIGIHFFNPPQLMPLVEIIKGDLTSERTVNQSLDVINNLKKEIVICKKDVPGFIVNRILGPLIQEAAWVVHREEATISEIDSMVKYKIGIPMGLFELADYTGIDILYNAAKEVSKRDPKALNLCPMFKDYFDKGWYGKKTQKGFYEYNNKKTDKPEISNKLSEKIDPIKIFSPAINEAYWIVRKGVASKEDVEKAIMMGLGFPTGILKMANKWGIKNVLKTLEENKKKYGEYYSPDPLIVKNANNELETSTNNEYEEIQIKIEPPIAELILNRPHRLNTITIKMMEEIENALDSIKNNKEVRVLIFRGSGNKAFSAGADINTFVGLSAEDAVKIAYRFHEVFDKIENFPKPTIAAIDGYALGGGCEIALTCDFRISSNRSEIGQTEISLGLIPGAGGTQRLPKIIGESKAKEMILLGKKISGEEAEELRLVNTVIPYKEFDKEIKKFASKLAEGPPIALELAKLSIQMSRNETAKNGKKFEAEAFGKVFSSKDLMEGISSFMMKKKPKFKGE